MHFRNCLAVAASLSLGLASMSLAQVAGKVTLSGKAPEAKPIDMSGVKDCHALHADPVTEDMIVVSEKGDLANVVVSVKTDDPAALGGEVPKDAAVVDQKGCMYEPHVIAMMVGQKLVVKNDDAFAHNVQSLAQANPNFNMMQQNKNPGQEPPAAPKVAENIKLKCAVHPWMAAWLIVLDHPFFSVSKEDGKFEIKGLPDGEYTLQAWHEKLGTQEKKVTVKDGKAEANFEFKSAAAAEPAPGAPVFASTSGTAASCCEPGETVNAISTMSPAKP